ncbi:endonuclease/exonuclease/phosphatase family protein [Alistipes sp.]|uniref:endonuclease/exonuclease/phosphatase family protein n=1 Tax=Alistipes sp. TaxID=1872444 RepID=UPI003AF57F80
MGRKAVSYLLYSLSVAVTGLLLAAAVLSWRASFVAPGQGGFWATIALLMPAILLANLLALVWWLVRRKWVVALMPVAALGLNLGYISAMVQLPDFSTADGPHDIRVATLNVNGFRRLGSLSATADAVARVMQRENVDVLCLQEFMDGREFPADSIGALFARSMPYFVHAGSAALASRYPILDYTYAQFPDTSNDYLCADLLVDRDTVRIFSVHLQTSGIAQLRRRFRTDYNLGIPPVDTLLVAWESNSSIRAGQVREIRAAIDASPYPVILAGDFNDTPSSYAYRQMKGDMTDGFRAVGNGYGGTFRYLGGLLRIDYIFYGGDFAGVRYYTLGDDISDHKAVIAGVRFK